MPTFEAIILDMDGVVTRTATLHAKAWKSLFDEFLCKRAGDRAGSKGRFKPFDEVADYREYVDGKMRVDGIRGFLGSRGIDLGTRGINELADEKERIFLEILAREGTQVFDDAIRSIHRWKKEKLKIALVTSSKNCEAVLKSAGILDLFDAKVDGIDLEKRDLPGKPSPDIFLVAAGALNTSPHRAVVIEDAVAGVKAGRLGAFGEVIGVARESDGADLLTAGADLVVKSLDEIEFAERIEQARAGWRLSYDVWEERSEPLRETLCTLGNGFFGTRGAVEESADDGVHYPGTYLSGAYNRLSSEVDGLAFDNEDLVNWPNWLCLCFRSEDGDWLDLGIQKRVSWSQELDMECGVLSRNFRVRDSQGRQTRVISRRVVSLESPHLGAIEWEVVPENWSGKLTVRSALDGTVRNNGVARWQMLNGQHLQFIEEGDFAVSAASEGETGIYLVVETNQSHLRMAQAAIMRAYRGDRPISTKETRIHRQPGYIVQEREIEVQQNAPIRIEKIVSIHSSRDHATGDPLEAAQKSVRRQSGFAELASAQGRRWSGLWREFGMELGASPRAQMALRLHQFHLLQTYSMNSVERDVGMPARGLHGEGYRGHVFWDELFIFPFFNFRMPSLSREMLQYRYRRLDEARWIARQSGFCGAMYPWQSASTGTEETPRYHLNPDSGTWLPERTNLQIHVGSAIVYNIWQYYQVTQDREFLSHYGAEMMLEIARFWASRASFNPKRRRYDIRGVVGPDEFHTFYPASKTPGIDNNAYTNIMASWSIRKASFIVKKMGREKRTEMLGNLGITEAELEHWNHVSKRLYLSIGEDGIIEQFEGYRDLKPIHLEKYRKKYGDIQRLDRILESQGHSPEEFDALKQADVLMLFYLFSVEELQENFRHLGYPFDPRWIQKNIKHYLARTVHGSTLSRGVSSWVLARLDRRMSWDLFEKALESDLSDIQGGTTAEGVHLGGMSLTVDIVQRCYSGMELRNDVLWFNPLLPEELQSARLRVYYRGHWLSILITQQELCIAVDRSWHPSAKIGFDGEIHVIRQGELKQFCLKTRKRPREKKAA